MSRKILVSVLGAFVVAALAACGSTKPESDADKVAFEKECEGAIARFKGADPSIENWFKTAYGYAIFPSVGKGGVGVGGAHGRAQVYEQGKVIGYARMTQATIGLQLGGQSFAEVIFFKDKSALDAFKSGNYELGAQASAVAAKSGAAAQTDYSGGVAIFTVVEGGLMAEASVGGQKFSFEPL